MMPMYSLILIHRGDIYKNDFLEIVSRIQRAAPDISTILRSHEDADLLPDVVWSQPTLIASFHTYYRLVPKRGRIYCAFAIEKQVQAELFQKAGVLTPKTALFNFGKRLDEASWGELIVLKPVHVNSSGLGIHLVRTGTQACTVLVSFTLLKPMPVGTRGCSPAQPAKRRGLPLASRV